MDAVNPTVMDTKRGSGKAVEELCLCAPLASSLPSHFLPMLAVCSVPEIQDEDE